MAPTLSQALGFYERQENPSILTTGHDDFDFADDWNEQDNHSTLRWRNSCPDKRPSPSSSRWSSCLTSLSSSVSTALTKQLSVGESTRRAISQLRNSMIEVSTRTESSLRASMPVRHRFSKADIGRFKDQPESEKAGDEDMEENTSDEDKKSLHSTKSRTQDCR
ncbi:hypothetical protein PI124_g13445 [Phytophthora idaei]|nr:hypothetical protein PI125_g13036 [Phytophthora idaei]KAG3149283.1 hypothetical protein PI126_g12082 [Phytophthora idaei]KAG3241699.1 hypothetical protein PI124_g13445 [Phytophthora idaei]